MRLFDPNDEKQLNSFYHSKHWYRLRIEVLQEQHYECQYCKAKGKLTLLKRSPDDNSSKRVRANVHHVKEIKERPDLRLSKYFVDEYGNKQRQLVASCDDCHNEEHKRFENAAAKPQFNEEKW